MGLSFPKVYLRWREPLAVKRRLHKGDRRSAAWSIIIYFFIALILWETYGREMLLWKAILLLSLFAAICLLSRTFERRAATLSENGVQLDYGYYRKLLKYQEIVSVRLYELCISQQAFSIIELQTKKQCIAVGVADEACLQKATAVPMERGVTEIFDERGQPASEPGGARS